MKRTNVVIAATIAVAAVAALAVSAVYLNGGGDGNVPARPAGSPAARDAAAEGASPLRPRSGRLAAFVVHAAPKPVPEAVFMASDGGTRNLAAWRGKVVLFNLWATWCAPCLEEMPALDRLQARLGGDRFEVVAVSLDRSGFDKPRAFYEKVGIEHLALYNDPTTRLAGKLGAVGMPTTILFDADGREIGRMAGPAEWDSDAAVELITAALGMKS